MNRHQAFSKSLKRGPAALLLALSVLAVAVAASGEEGRVGESKSRATERSLVLFRPVQEGYVLFPELEAVAIPDPPAGTWGVVASGTGGGAIFRDEDSQAEAWLGTNSIGVKGYGSLYGGYFRNSDATGQAALGWGNLGVFATGSVAGGQFSGTYGIEASGTDAGGHFKDSGGSGEAWVGDDDYGITAKGTSAGGWFLESNLSSSALVASGGYGIDAGGNSAGGHFMDTTGSGEAWVGRGDRGIEATGSEMGGYFTDSDGTSEARVAYDRVGVRGKGALSGGFFNSSESKGGVYVGYYDGTGVYGWGLPRGAFFQGSLYGAQFEDTPDEAWVRAAWDTYKIYGNGEVSFVQNHPYDASSVIVYAAPEGDEVATYTRGSARLMDGEARVALGETFRWVTNPDIGLTTYLTPLGDWCDLYVAEQGSETLVVRSRDGTDCTFNYLVYGLRIGFEETTVVQEKTEEAWIPSMSSHRKRLLRRPDLARYTALSRFVAQRQRLGITEPLDTSRAKALVAAVHEFDPAVDGVEWSVPELPTLPDEEEASTLPGPVAPDDAQSPTGRRMDPTGPGAPVLAPGVEDVRARSFRPSASDLSAMMPVIGTVEPGDVLVIGPYGAAVRADTASASTVVGVVAAEPGVVLGDDGRAEPQVPVVFSGIASCKVDGWYGAISAGDLLVTSPTPGHAMRADKPAAGTVLGKALEDHTEGEGMIRVLVMLR